MNKYILKPGLSIGPINVGMSKSDVFTIFGNGKYLDKNRVMYHNGFFINFSSNNFVEFIETGKSDIFSVYLDDYDLHRTPISQVLKIVEKYDAYEKDIPDPEYSYIFKLVQISLWRGTLDRNYFESIGQAENKYF